MIQCQIFKKFYHLYTENEDLFKVFEKQFSSSWKIQINMLLKIKYVKII